MAFPITVGDSPEKGSVEIKPMLSQKGETVSGGREDSSRLQLKRKDGKCKPIALLIRSKSTE